MFNATTVVGRLTRDAELGQLPNARQTPRVRFTVAVDRDYEVGGETPTDFWPVEILGEYGPRLAPYLTKGRLVLINGTAHIDERREEGGQYRVFPYLRGRRVRFLDHKARQESEAGSADEL